MTLKRGDVVLARVPHVAGTRGLTIDISTPEGQATGLHKNGVVSCLHLVTMSMDRLDPAIGALSPQLLQKLDGCMKVALGLT